MLQIRNDLFQIRKQLWIFIEFQPIGIIEAYLKIKYKKHLKFNQKGESTNYRLFSISELTPTVHACQNSQAYNYCRNNIFIYLLFNFFAGSQTIKFLVRIQSKVPDPSGSTTLGKNIDVCAHCPEGWYGLLRRSLWSHMNFLSEVNSRAFYASLSAFYLAWLSIFMSWIGNCDQPIVQLHVLLYCT